MEQRYGPPTAPGIVNRSVLYADDTLLIEVDENIAQYYMECVRSLGLEYGLHLNNKKLEVLAVNHDGAITLPDGSAVKRKQCMTYLGSLLSADGRSGPELDRRLGLAEQTFKDLRRVWGHANVSRSRKMFIYESFVLPRLMYSLHTAWLNKAEVKRLDGFHCRCLRRIFGIPPSFVSRVSNEDVLSTACTGAFG